MNCDQAFDAMTHPDGPDSPELSRHLQSCPRCRQMFETLEPALGLFTAVHEPPADAPAVASSLQMAQQVAARMTSESRPDSETVPRRRQWGAWLTAAVAGIALAVGMSALLPQRQFPPAGRADECLWNMRGTDLPEAAARDLVASCVACHLSRASQDEQAGLIQFSAELERMVQQWQQQAIPASSPAGVLIACDFRFVAPRVGLLCGAGFQPA